MGTDPVVFCCYGYRIRLRCHYSFFVSAAAGDRCSAKYRILSVLFISCSRIFFVTHHGIAKRQLYFSIRTAKNFYGWVRVH